MIRPSGKPVYIPPFSGVRLVEYRDRLQLVPVPEVRSVFGYGKIKARKAKEYSDECNPMEFWTDLGPDDELWVVMQWYVFSDGHREPGNISFLRSECTEEDAKASMERMERFENLTREELIELSHCFRATDEDEEYVDDKCPNYQSEPDPSATDEYDVYHARLKVMSELQPKTVELIKIADATKDPKKRQIVERQAVQSYFAELAHYFTEDEILAWQRSNPAGTGWLCEFGEVMKNPRRQLDPINHELALNWLRQKYNDMSAKQLCDTVLGRVWSWLRPGFRMTADFIKKRRERLGLTTKRKPGAPEK